MMRKLVWYYRRLKSMSAQEVVYRLRNLLMFRLEKSGYFTVPTPPTPNTSRRGAKWAAAPSCLDGGPYQKQAQRIADGVMDIFALKKAELGNPPEWNRDPRKGVLAPLTYGKSMDYRDESLVGDIKYLWEPNRHLQFVRLAQAFALTDDVKYLEVLRELLLSWFDQCPYLIGPNWVSSLELGIRLINWSLVWQYVGGLSSVLFHGPEGEVLKKKWLESIYQHVHFVNSHYSRFSSANNHLIGEAAGVVVATKTWPYWDAFSSFGERAVTILEEEMVKQNYSDGVNCEQAVSYQQFVLDFALSAGLACKSAGMPLSTRFWERMERMMEYLAALVDFGGNVPMFGDADDGYAVDLSPEEDFCPYRSLLATGAILFNRGDFRSIAGMLDHKTLWLTGDEGIESFSQLEQKLERHTGSFTEGGYYIVGDALGTAEEIKGIIDCGPVGYLSIAAHGHADALSFYLSAGGRELLVDPGTYAYHTKQKWRDYFRGTAAHNTVRVDGVDQSVIGGNFMWLEKAHSELLEFSANANRTVFRGCHDGYGRLADPVKHERAIEFEPDFGRFRILDTLYCSGKHQVERFWHCHEDCEIHRDGDWVIIDNGKSRLRLKSVGTKCNLEIVRGNETPPGGWVSRHFDVKKPSYTVVMTDSIEGKTELSSELVVELLG